MYLPTAPARREVRSPFLLSLLLAAGIGTTPVSLADGTPAGPDAATAALIERLGLVEAPQPVRERSGWAPPKVVLIRATTAERIAALQAVAPGVKFVQAADDAESARLAAAADVAMGFCSGDLLAAGERIRWVQVWSAGVERCVSAPGLRERDIMLTNMQRVAGPVMAEHVLAMIFAFARGLEFYVPERMARRWTEQPPPPTRLMSIEGKTLLVVGLGGIGTEVARRASALGMTVNAIRASGREGPPFVKYVGLPGELHALAAAADFIVNTTPLTPETRNLYDAKFFDAAKPGAYFINVGRGQSVVQKDLVAALRSGRLAGAGLDVTEPEPLPPDDPLWTFGNVILTPHVSAASDLGDAARFAIARENLRRYVAGERMLSVVDVTRGY